jgi:integrase
VKERRQGKTTLKQLLDAFFEHLNVKSSTVRGYQMTRDELIDYFGADTALAEIDPLRADEWRAAMKSSGLAEATISTRVKRARQMFRQAVRWKMLVENPFADVKTGSQVNKSRQRFITRQDSQKVLDACPDAQWRLLFALSRYGGLRCPSEHLALKWSDVDWGRGSFRVTCIKTEHHGGRDERRVPIFPELRPHLLKAFEDAEPGTEHVITRYRDKNSNLRTQLNRIIRRAGLTPWPRLFHNLRATRQTELAERFPAHVVCAWIGNSERVAQNHYLQVTDAHMALAGAELPNSIAPAGAAQNPAQYPADGGNRRAEKPGFTGQSRSLQLLTG